MLVVMDGDYSSLTFALHDPDKFGFPPGLGQRMDRHFRDAVFAQPEIMRQLPALLPQAGWELAGPLTQAKCVSEVGADPSYWVSFAQAYKDRVVAAGLIDDVGGAEMADKWWGAQTRQISDGTFFAHCVYYTMFAEAV